ncbi:hypothetical protein EVAR_40208_1 [Eumeta japonica]|uniref:Uncharacterized protein n=1 Tax=Eumeta variegata TaxID=151549 RepID=A0A4C1XNX5_EUMVA|nr:hypothetical protein EVAR_40208_1 [Eumeta japonica]
MPSGGALRRWKWLTVEILIVISNPTTLHRARHVWMPSAVALLQVIRSDLLGIGSREGLRHGSEPLNDASVRRARRELKH